MVGTSAGSRASALSFLGVNIDVFSNVYTPAEDSFMLAKHSHNLSGNILEIGTGCGIAALVNASRNPSNYVVGVDINPHAINNAEYNARHNRIKNVQFIHSDMFANVPKHRRFDGILFNPPYLPTNDDVKETGFIKLALDGGSDGRRQTDRFLKSINEYLLPGGKALMIQSSVNDLHKTINMAHARGFSTEILEEQKFFFEQLYLLRFQRAPQGEYPLSGFTPNPPSFW